MVPAYELLLFALAGAISLCGIVAGVLGGLSVRLAADMKNG